MKLLVLLTIATIKCNGRSLLDHHQIQNSDIQDENIAKRDGLSVRSPTITSTLDPWDEFCREACGEGLAGPECDCPEHLYIKTNEYKLKQSVLSNSDILSVRTPARTTTLDPWVEFCKEACGVGLAGPECDCPEHLYSQKNVPNHKQSVLSKNIFSVSTPTRTTTLDPWDEFCKEACVEGLAGPECDCPEHLNLNKSVYKQKQSDLSKGNILSVHTPISTTTPDPWHEFCKEACEEGLAGAECDCPEHPIG